MNKLPLEPEWDLAVVLTTPPRPIVIPRSALSFDVLGQHFEDSGLGGHNAHNGFYDFLRTQTGAVIGVRFTPDADASLALEAVPEGQGFRRVVEGKLTALLITWAPGEDFDPELSMDQYFGNNVIYRAAASGTLAIGFAVDPLSLEEIASLKETLNANRAS